MKNENRGMSRRTVAILLALVLLIGCAVGGTLAWLTDKTTEVKNTFTYGDINIDLKEHSYNDATYQLNTGNENLVTSVNNYKIIPGVDLPKDPFVTVKAGSEKCYVFIKVVESNWPTFTETNSTTRKVNYSIITTGTNAWTPLTEDKDGNKLTGVYYMEVDVSKDTTDKTIQILTENKVTVSGNLTKTEVNGIETGAAAPTLTFTAYAVQYQQNATTHFTAAEAWAKVATPTT